MVTAMNESYTPCAVIIGVGASKGIGAALCRRAAKAGLLVYVVGRSNQKLALIVNELQATGAQAITCSLDACNAKQVQQLFEQIQAQQHQPVWVVHNVGSNMPSRFLHSSTAFFEKMWMHTFLSAVISSQAALKAMQPFAQGTLLFTGASASLRGKPNFSAFTLGKGSLREYSLLLAQLAAPHGIHVAHVVIDGVVDGDRINQFAGGIGRLLRWVLKGPKGSLHVEDIAEQYWRLHVQQPTLWLSELDLRPFKEVF